jgi:CelD/BcsL family acetyltransferase involved in cellulose biosynthesis
MELLSVSSLTTAARQSWSALAHRAAEPNPFFEPVFLLPAWQALGGDDVFLLVHAEQGTWLACMPVQLRRVLRGPRLLSTWSHPYSFLGTPLVDRDRVDCFSRTLTNWVAAHEHSRFLVLRNLGEGSVLTSIRTRTNGEGPTRMIYEESHERAVLRRHEAGGYLTELKPHKRRELNRLRRRLGEEVGGGLDVRDRSEDPAAVEDFLRLERSGWKGAAGTAMAAREHDADMFRRLCSSFSRDGRLQLLSLEAEGKPLAMKCNLAAGSTLFCFKIAYDERYHRFSPGVLLELDNIEFFHTRRGELLMDSCADPNHPMINRLWRERRTIVTTMIGPGGSLGWAANRTRTALHAARARRKRIGRKTENRPR